jgi:phosphate transport system protein
MRNAMSVHLLREIDNLKRDILMVDAMAEQSLREATLAVERRDAKLAQSVIEKDATIDQAEVEVEENCLRILALHQPVAIDLRFVITVLEIDYDLERVGNLAVNMAEHALCLAEQPEINIDFRFTVMAVKVQAMLKKSLDALVELDPSLAREVCSGDNEVDVMNRRAYTSVEKAIRRNPGHSKSLLHMLSVARCLERVAHYATSIAEDVIYMIEGGIAQHKARPA